MVRGIIFDFDGVIVDSEVFYLQSLVAYLKTMDIEASVEDVKHVLGQNMNDIADCIITQYGLKIGPEKMIKDSTAVFNDMLKEHVFEPMKGLIPFLERCRDKDVKMAIASSSDYAYLYKIMDQTDIRDFFSLVLSGEDFVHSKPDPEIYNVAQSRLGIAKDELLIIEDSVNGIRAGKASGIRTIGFKGSVVEQDTSQADEEVNDFSEIDI